MDEPITKTRGDTIEILLSFDPPMDITGNNFRFEAWDPKDPENPASIIKKASAGIAGGGDDQILIVNTGKGEIRVIIDAGETDDIEVSNLSFEVEMEVPGDPVKVHTVLPGTEGKIKLVDQRIKASEW